MTGLKSKKPNSLIDRLDKDVKGSLTFILIILIIKTEKRTWGYQIKKKLQILTQSDSAISDSTLYTVLRNLENNYWLIESEVEERRRYYSLTKLGITETDRVAKYWQNLLLTSVELFQKLDVKAEKNFMEKVE